MFGLINKTIYRSADGGGAGASGGGGAVADAPKTDTPPQSGGATTAQDNAPPAGDNPQSTTPDDIKDPIAFFKAQAEKNERLRVKAQAEADEAKKLAETLQNDVVKGLTAKYEALLAEFETIRQQATQATAEALRARVAGEFKISGEGLAFLTATDEAGLREQAERLSKLTSKPTPPPSGNVGNPASGGGLTLADYAKMTPQEVKSRLTEVTALLTKG